MYIECPECKSCFMIKGKELPADTERFRCGVCRNVFLFSRNKGLKNSEFFWKIRIMYRKYGLKPALLVLILAMFFLCVGMMWSVRDNLMNQYPAVKNVLTSCDGSKGNRISGLDFKNIQQRVIEENNSKVLEVTGLIVNNSGENTDIPAVQALILDNDGNRTESKVIYPKKRSLRPMESASFRMKILLMDGASGKAELNFISQ